MEDPGDADTDEPAFPEELDGVEDSEVVPEAEATVAGARYTAV
jgi:hypothetical protein